MTLFCPAAALAIILEEHATAGGSVSMIVTVNEHWLVLPAASVATHFTTVTPFAKVEPDAGAHTTVAPGQLSFTVTTNVTLEALHWPGSVEWTILVGQVIVGA